MQFWQNAEEFEERLGEAHIVILSWRHLMTADLFAANRSSRCDAAKAAAYHSCDSF